MNVRDQAAKTIEQYCTNNPFELCACLGIKVMRWPLEDMRGYFFQNDKGRIIVLNSTLGYEESRFVCAHEIGHYILHGGFNRVFLDSRTLMNAGRYEREADAFASFILMPEDQEILQSGFTISQLAEWSGMREDIIRLRIGMIDNFS